MTNRKFNWRSETKKKERNCAYIVRFCSLNAHCWAKWLGIFVKVDQCRWISIVSRFISMVKCLHVCGYLRAPQTHSRTCSNNISIFEYALLIDIRRFFSVNSLFFRCDVFFFSSFSLLSTSLQPFHFIAFAQCTPFDYRHYRFICTISSWRRPLFNHHQLLYEFATRQFHICKQQKWIDFTVYLRYNKTITLAAIEASSIVVDAAVIDHRRWWSSLWSSTVAIALYKLISSDVHIRSVIAADDHLPRWSMPTLQIITPFNKIPFKRII